MTRGTDTERPDAGMALLRAVAATLPRGRRVELAEMTSTAWASATFTGARHVIRLEAADDEGARWLDAWLAALPAAEFQLRGHLVADLAVASVDRVGAAAALVLEALTVEEG